MTQEIFLMWQNLQGGNIHGLNYNHWVLYILDGKLEIQQSDQSLAHLPSGVYVYPTLLESTKSLNDAEPPYIGQHKKPTSMED